MVYLNVVLIVELVQKEMLHSLSLPFVIANCIINLIRVV